VVSNVPCARLMTCPIPALDARYSDTIAPASAKPNATRTPPRIQTDTDGNST
jgi:hypothetical protein